MISIHHITSISAVAREGMTWVELHITGGYPCEPEAVVVNLYFQEADKAMAFARAVGLTEPVLEEIPF